jgi:hypothetical protein
MASSNVALLASHVLVEESGLKCILSGGSLLQYVCDFAEASTKLPLSALQRPDERLPAR